MILPMPVRKRFCYVDPAVPSVCGSDRCGGAQQARRGNGRRRAAAVGLVQTERCAQCPRCLGSVGSASKKESKMPQSFSRELYAEMF